MPEGNESFTQDQVNGLVGKARTEGRDAAQKELLKTLGFDSADDLQGFVKTVRDKQKGEMTEIERLQAENAALGKQVAGLTGERDGAVLKFKGVALEQAAEQIGSELGVTGPKAKQITKLLGVQAADFDPASNDLKAKFEAFLADADNAHFKAEPEAVRTTSSRKPGAAGANNEPDKLDKLAGSLKW